MSTTAVSAQLRRQVDQWAKTWLTAKFSRVLELRAQDPGPFNYPIAVFSEWRGKAFYLNVQYRARSRKPEDDFVVRHTDDAHRLRQIRPGVLSAHGQVV